MILNDHHNDLRLKLVLLAGIFLRVVVFFFQEPNNEDRHLEVITYILNHHALPLSHQTSQSYHPPLYYLLAVPWAFLGSEKIIQLFSLILSMANLGVLFILIKRSTLVAEPWVRYHMLCLASFLPQFVIFGNFISNDAFAFLAGTVIVFQATQTIEWPTGKNMSLLAVAGGFGLLIKGTFLAFVPPLILLVSILNLRQRFPWRYQVKQLLVFTAILIVVGGYKFVENMVSEGRPVVHNLDYEPFWMAFQTGTFRGLESIVDVNILKLLAHPTVSDATRHSIPLLFYGTFWFPYNFSESNFSGAIQLGFIFVPRLVYLAGLLPSLLMGLGLVVSVQRLRKIKTRSCAQNECFQTRLKESMNLLLFLMTLGLVITAGIKYDVWSSFQGRLLFPALASILFFYGWGIETISQWKKRLGSVVRVWLHMCYVVFVGFFVFEIILKTIYP